MKVNKNESQCLSHKMKVNVCHTKWMSMFVTLNESQCLSHKMEVNVCQTK